MERDKTNQEPSVGQPMQPMQPIERPDVPTVADTTVMDGHHRPRIGVILALIGGVFLLLFAGALIWFFGFYNSAKTIAADAIANVATSPNLHVKSTQEIVPTIEIGVQDSEHSASKLESVVIKSDSASRYYNDAMASSTDVTVSINTNNGKNTTSTDLNFGLVVDQDKNIYTNINGISDALNQTFAMTYGQQLAPFKDLITMLEKDWWQIDISDISYSLGLSADQQRALENSYNCIIDSLNKKNFGEVGEIYSRHQFLSAVKDSNHQAYRMEIDSAQLTDFLNEFLHGDIVNKIVACVNDAGKGFVSASIDNKKNIEVDEVAEVIKKMPTIYAKIDLFGHRMTQVFFDQTDASSHTEITANYDIEYPVSVEIKTPDSYRPASEAVQAFMQLSTQQSSEGSNVNSKTTTVETE